MTPVVSWLRERITMYSAATAVLLGAFALLLLVDVVTGSDPQFGRLGGLALVGVALLGALGFLTLGDRGGPWPALLLASAHIVPALLFLTVLERPLNAVAVILQLPVLALYLGGFLAPWLARTTQLATLLAFTSVIVWDPYHLVDQLGGGRNLPSMVCFTWLCLEAGIFVQKRFKRETHIDQLTGLYNRRGFIDRADAERARADRTGEPLCMALIDLDDFKRVNDTEGHNAGDRILRELSQEWKNAARKSDVIARVGGDEFIVLMPNTPIAGARVFMMRINSTRVHPWSWGLAEWSRGEMLSTVIARADDAMYRNKTGKYRRAEESVAAPDEPLTPIELPEPPQVTEEHSRDDVPEGSQVEVTEGPQGDVPERRAG